MSSCGIVSHSSRPDTQVYASVRDRFLSITYICGKRGVQLLRRAEYVRIILTEGRFWLVWLLPIIGEPTMVFLVQPSRLRLFYPYHKVIRSRPLSRNGGRK